MRDYFGTHCVYWSPLIMFSINSAVQEHMPRPCTLLLICLSPIQSTDPRKLENCCDCFYQVPSLVLWAVDQICAARLNPGWPFLCSEFTNMRRKFVYCRCAVCWMHWQMSAVQQSVFPSLCCSEVLCCWVKMLKLWQWAAQLSLHFVSYCSPLMQKCSYRRSLRTSYFTFLSFFFFP